MASATERAVQTELFTYMLDQQQRDYRSAALQSVVAITAILGVSVYALVYRTAYADDEWFKKYKLDVLADRLHLLLNNSTQLSELACKLSAGEYMPNKRLCSVKRERQ
jgi:hypothetical protein